MHSSLTVGTTAKTTTRIYTYKHIVKIQFIPKKFKYS